MGPVEGTCVLLQWGLRPFKEGGITSHGHQVIRHAHCPEKGGRAGPPSLSLEPGVLSPTPSPSSASTSRLKPSSLGCGRAQPPSLPALEALGAPLPLHGGERVTCMCSPGHPGKPEPWHSLGTPPCCLVICHIT